jgi:hypothetical protein
VPAVVANVAGPLKVAGVHLKGAAGTGACPCQVGRGALPAHVAFPVRDPPHSPAAAPR